MHSPVVFSVHQVVAGTECHQMGVVGRCGYADRAGASYIGMAHLVGELLQLVRIQVVVVPQHLEWGDHIHRYSIIHNLITQHTW